MAAGKGGPAVATHLDDQAARKSIATARIRSLAFIGMETADGCLQDPILAVPEW